MPGLKKCYYEVLGVERNAGDDEIKKSFRKLALLSHPDKNPDRVDEAKAEFQVLQQAYEVLSNPQERAWYDKHRQAVLREGLDPDFDDFNIDLMAYCTSSCYKGFGDDDEGFYAVYRELFAKLTAEELDAGWADEHEEDIPNFGDSGSSFEDVVGPFYAFWESFCSVKSFAWNDEYDTRRAECRRIARLMEKENKKIRMDAKKAWNREVRALVDFVKRKDKRVQAWKVIQEAKLKEKEEELARKAKETKLQRLADRKKLLESAKVNKARKEQHQNPVLQEMEQWMSNEFGEQLSGNESDEDMPTCFHCAACNKSFRTEKAYMNHEKSKKHLQQVEKLKELMKEDDQLFQSSEGEEAHGETEDAASLDEEEAAEEDSETEDTIEQLDSMNLEKKSTSEPEDHDKSDGGESDDDLLQHHFVARAANRKREDVKFTPHVDSESEPEQFVASTILHASDDEPEKESSSKKPKKAKKKGKKASGSGTGSEKTVIPPSTSNSKSSKSIITGGDVDVTCLGCGEKFDTKSQLFKHIKSTGHAAPLENVQQAKKIPAPGERPIRKGGKKSGKKSDKFNDFD